jgi:hypothetical protein
LHCLVNSFFGLFLANRKFSSGFPPPPRNSKGSERPAAVSNAKNRQGPAMVNREQKTFFVSDILISFYLTRERKGFINGG